MNASLPDVQALSAGRVFTGDRWLDNHTVLYDRQRILQILPTGSVDPAVPRRDFPDGILAPAFLDLQIYGAYGKLLAVYPEPDSLARLEQYCRSGGAKYCMPTVATNDAAVFRRSIDAIRAYWKAGGTGVLGLHVEGPWINPVRKGAHLERFIHAPSLDEVKDLLDYGQDVIRIITLAPEVCSPEVIRYLLSRGIILSAGHSNASYQEAMEGFHLGIPAATHLYNAMSPLQHRAPGLVGAVFNHPSVMASIIPDGHHVDFPAIRIAKKMLGERLFVITDAVTQTEEGPYPHQLVGDKYESAGILSGSALTLNRAVRNLVEMTEIPLEEALRMCSLYPARVVRLDQRLGRIAPGFEPALVALDRDLNVLGMS
ncbi:MAG TPA: N-acetylglucosamine-6-phosphate deacetylase [Chitinophagaceae bacterium]|nr:N-acetylglucosamine-6-phosphate deacetylase [Chitinophagaceae bacterium]